MTDFQGTDIRVFLSSTFSDMQETRNYLTRKIFPKIEQECARRGVTFSVLDLRWGITENESKNGKVIEICIDEINRTRPFFIGLVGERYGWIPDEQEIQKNRHLEEKYPWVREYIGRRCSITEIEMQYGVLNNDSIQDAYFFIKRTKPRGIPENEEEKKLSELRKTIMQKAGEGKCTAEIYSSVEELGRLLHDRLMEMIEKRFPADGKLNESDLYYLREEGNLTALRRNYIDLDNRVRNLESNILHTDILFVTGGSGCGKSALLANSFINSQESVIRTAIDDSVNSIGRLISLFLYKLDPVAGEMTKAEEEEIIEKYREHAYPEPVIWIIDGLEKLPVEDIYSIMPLLTPPEKIRIVISVEEQYFKKNSITDLLHESFPVIVEPSPLNEAEKLLFVGKRLQECGKKLTERQEMHILSSPFLSNPQFLKIFVEELIQFGVYEKLDAFIEGLSGASDRKDFINRILEISEKEFKAGEIERVLSVTAYSLCGIGEKEYVSEFGYTPLAWSAIYRAVEPFIYRQGRTLIMRSSEFRGYIIERYLDTGSKMEKVRQLCTRLLLKERAALSGKAGLSLIEKLIYKLLGFYISTDFAQRFNNIHGELVMQYIALGKWKRANKMLCNIFPCIFAFGLRYYQILGSGIEHGLDVRRLFSLKNLLLFNYINRDTTIFYSRGMLAYIAGCNAGSYSSLRRHFRLMPVPRSLKRTLIDITDSVFGKKENGGIAEKFEEQWLPGKYEIEPGNAAAIFEQINIISDSDRIEKIQSAAQAMVSASEKDSLNWLYFTSYSALCSAISGNVGRAKELFRDVLESSTVNPLSLHYLKFAISYSESDWESCRELTDELREWTVALPDEIRRNMSRIVLCYRIATEENDPEADVNYDRKALIAEYEKLAGGKDFDGNMNYLAQWLTAREVPGPAADVYAELAAKTENEGERANYYSLLAGCLESCSAPDYGVIAGIWEKSAQCYMAAGKEHYIDMDNAMNSAIKAYNRIQAWPQSEKLTVKRYGYANEMEQSYTPEEMAERYNRIAIRCAELETVTVPGIKEIALTSMKKSMSAEEDKILYFKNFIFNLNEITRKGWLAAEEIDDALKFITPYLELDTAGESLPTLFFLGCLYNEKLAYSALEKAKELGITISNAGYEWDNLLLKACSDDKAESLRNIEIIKKRMIEGNEPYNWEDCRKLKLDKRIKTACSHEKGEEVLLLWMIAKLENNTREAVTLQSEIRDFAVNEKGTGIIDRFINLNSYFYTGRTIEWILFQIRLYMEWKPGYATIEEWCLTSVSMVLNERCQYQLLERLEPFYSECIAAAENPSETLLEILKGLPTPETGSFEMDSYSATGIVKAVTSPLREGIFALDDICHARMESCVKEYLEFAAESPDSGVEILSKIYDLYKSLNIKTNNNIVSAMLITKIPVIEQHDYSDGLCGEFFAALESSIAQGYTPDTNMLGSIVWACFLQGDLQKAAESLPEFEAAVTEELKYAPVLTFFHAMIESGMGKYPEAAAMFGKVLGTFETVEGNDEGHEEKYCAIPGIFTEICGDELSFEFVFLHSLVLSEIYAGLYKEGLEHCEMLAEYDESAVTLLNCLVLHRNGLPEEAAHQLERIEYEKDTYTACTLQLLITLEKARECIESGNMEEAAGIVEDARGHICKSMPPLCRHELEQACKLLSGMQ